MSKNSLCWKGRIRTAVPVREQIYSLSVLTTHPPSSNGNRNNFIRNLIRTLKYSTSHTIRELYLVCTLAPNALPACYSTHPLFPKCGVDGIRTTWHGRFTDLLYHGKNYAFHLSYYTILYRGWDSNPHASQHWFLRPAWLPLHHLGNYFIHKSKTIFVFQPYKDMEFYLTVK